MFIRKRISFAHELNDQQLAVVTSGEGPVLVIAGAGSGKTRTLTYRVAYLIEQGVDPFSLLLVTFTNKAAQDMLNRVATLVPHDIKKLWGGTFHHIANRILRVHAPRLGFQSNFTILDQQDAIDLLNSCFMDLGYKKKSKLLPQGAVLSRMFSLAHNMRLSLPELIEQRQPYFIQCLKEINAIYQHYTKKKQQLNLLDFDDLLIYWLRLMEEDAALKEFYARRFCYILVDEYQDTNKLQADIIDALAYLHKNLMVVGDDSQSIYSFRGADFSNIIDFPRRYPDTRIYKLEYNYRSTPEILHLANQSIIYNEKQFRKELRPMRSHSVHPLFVPVESVFQQAAFVSHTIQEFLSAGMRPGNIAVLYRAHYHSMELQMQLTRLGIAFEIRSGIRFFEQAHIKDIAAYLKILLNPFDEVAWKRILQFLPAIGKVRSQRVWERLANSSNPLIECREVAIETYIPPVAKPFWANLCGVLQALAHTGREVSPGLLIKTIMDGGYQEYMRTRYHDPASRAEDIERFMEFGSHYNGLADFLAELALLTSVEAEDVAADKGRETVKLTTIHQAKGLEWPVVFVISLAEGSFPNPRTIYRQEDEEEERRLFYVAVTRAKDQLYLCSPLTLGEHGPPVKPSRFIRELPQHCFAKLPAPGVVYDYR